MFCSRCHDSKFRPRIQSDLEVSFASHAYAKGFRSQAYAKGFRSKILSPGLQPLKVVVPRSANTESFGSWTVATMYRIC